MKVKDIRELRDNELQEKLQDLEKHLFTLRSQAVTEKIANAHSVRNIRKEIARVKTIIRERELKGQ